MTRYLSEALEAPEPSFRKSLQKLELANGSSGTDIRLSTELMAAARGKIRELGLDPADTTAEELFGALKQRVRVSDQLLITRLRTLAASQINAEAEITAGMSLALNRLEGNKPCFSLKTNKLKSLIKLVPPKKTMKGLGYRSLDSMLKHEPAALILAAGLITESTAWQKRFYDQYKSLTSADFEDKQIAILHPSSPRWRALAAGHTNKTKHNLLTIKEAGVIVLLPLPSDIPEGVITASFCLALEAHNQIISASSYLRLNQVKPSFGQTILGLVKADPVLKSDLFAQFVPWQLLHRYYAQAPKQFSEALFEPYLKAEQMIWPAIEALLTKIEPSFSFWQGTHHLSLLHNRRPISFNILDSALNLCNDLGLNNRSTAHFKKSLWQELSLRYLKHDQVAEAVLAEVQPQLVEEAS